MVPKRRALASAALVSLSFVGVAGLSGIPAAVAAPSALSARPQLTTGPTSNAIVVSAIAALDSLRSGNITELQSYTAQLASEVAAAAGLDAALLAEVWGRTDSVRMTVVFSALSQVGVPYRRNTSTPGRGFDCSGLVSWAWGETGVELPHQSRSIINGVAATSLDSVLPGDVIYYPGHIELALGVGDSFVHAPSSGKTVEVKAGHRSGKRLSYGNPLG